MTSLGLPLRLHLSYTWHNFSSPSLCLPTESLIVQTCVAIPWDSERKENKNEKNFAFLTLSTNLFQTNWPTNSKPSQVNPRELIGSTSDFSEIFDDRFPKSRVSDVLYILLTLKSVEILWHHFFLWNHLVYCYYRLSVFLKNHPERVSIFLLKKTWRLVSFSGVCFQGRTFDKRHWRNMSRNNEE